jgi:DNA-binding transcriptional ArsR family regulator
MATTKQEAAYADEAPLVELFGKPARTRLISVFLDEAERDLNVSEIARQAGVARSTVYDHLDDLRDLGIVTVSRETEQGPRYTLDESNKLPSKLREVEGLALRALLAGRDDVDFE